MPDPTLGAGLLLGGRLLGALGGASAARKQNALLAQGQRSQNVAGMQSAGVLGDAITQLGRSRPNPAAEQASFSAALGPESVSGPPTASRAFRNSAAGATAGARGYGSDLAGLFARIRAPGLQRRDESYALTEAGNALRPIQMRAQDDAFMTELRAGMKQPNPWLGLLSNGLQNAGGYMIRQGT